MSRICYWCLFIVLATAGSTAHAQQEAAAQAYAAGVHQYFAGLNPEAYQSFTRSLQSGSNDPRCYYFRGLASYRQGRTSEAQADFDSGAALETGAAAGLYAIDRSLERVQGWPRVQIEQRRALARSHAAQQLAIDRVQQQRRNANADRNVAVFARPQPGDPAGAAANPFAERDPFGESSAPAVRAEVAPGELPEAPAPVAPAPKAVDAPPPVDGAAVAPTAPAVEEGKGAGGAAAFGGMLKKAFGGMIPNVKLPTPPGLPGISPTDPPAPQAAPPKKP